MLISLVPWCAVESFLWLPSSYIIQGGTDRLMLVDARSMAILRSLHRSTEDESRCAWFRPQRFCVCRSVKQRMKKTRITEKTDRNENNRKNRFPFLLHLKPPWPSPWLRPGSVPSLSPSSLQKMFGPQKLLSKEAKLLSRFTSLEKKQSMAFLLNPRLLLPLLLLLCSVSLASRFFSAFLFLFLS